MGKKDNLVATFLGFLIICIFSITIYFCLDIFGIIEVPEKYSLTQFFRTSITDVSVATSLEDIINKENIDEFINKSNNEISNSNVQNVVLLEDGEYENKQTIDENSNNVVNRMYYSQLDVYGRMIYDEFNSHREELKTGTYVVDFDKKFNELLHEENGSEKLENSFQLALNALLFDNPEIFYIDITKIYMSTEVTSFGPLKTYRVKIGALEGDNYLYEFFSNQESVEIAISQVEQIKNKVIKSTYGEIYYKIKTVHDYLISNTEYDKTLQKDNIYTLYGALVGRTAVCEGYAKAFKYILDEMNIPCIIACGIGQNSNGETESHAWNYVKIDDIWYAVDCTWDDPVIVGNGYVSQEIYTKYFMKGSRDFFKDHLEDGNIVKGASFVYPTISEENYR